MAHRTDFRNVAREICLHFNLSPTFMESFERHLHDAHTAGIVGEPCRCRSCSPTRPDAKTMYPWPPEPKKEEEP